MRSDGVEFVRPSSGVSPIECLESRTLLSAAPHSVSPAAAALPTSATTLNVKPTTGLLGQDFKVTVKVKGKHGKVSGAVQILDNGAPISAAGQTFALGLKGGHAKYVFGAGDVALEAGQHVLTAQYTGNLTLPASTSPAVNVTVSAPTYSTATDGLQTATVKKGHGKAAANGNTVRIAYTGYLASDGSIFDYATANHGSGSPPYFEFQVGAQQAIQGFDEGVVGMKVGEERTVFIPSALGYGATGSGTAIPPDSDLVFLLKRIK